jgi:hypothetical protein
MFTTLVTAGAVLATALTGGGLAEPHQATPATAAETPHVRVVDRSAADHDVAPTSGSTVHTQYPVITGTATPGSGVLITRDSVELGLAIAGADGTWRIELHQPLVEGGNDMLVTMVTPDGTASWFSYSLTYEA